jgi:signal transduction histidine kinase
MAGTESRDRLDAAAEALVERWQTFRTDAVSQAELAAVLAALTSRVAAALAGRPETDAGAEVATPLERKLLVGLRREVLSDAALDTSAADGPTIALLRAIESVAESLDPAWSERFQDRLTGPSGLDLVVEVAHDLRSPLTSILFLAETMLRGRSGPLTALQERQLGLVYSAAFGLNAVASDVIELVRGGDRLVGREALPFSVTEVLESVNDIVLPIAEEKGLTLTLTAPTHDLRVGHPGALNRVLLNLTTNALKFTSEGGVEVRLVEDGADPGRLQCLVRDSGRGIPDAAMPTLFEPFRRRHQAGDYAFSGSGLGLSICRMLIEAMGSTLEVATVLGEGTTFSFTVALPIVDETVS